MALFAVIISGPAANHPHPLPAAIIVIPSAFPFFAASLIALLIELQMTSSCIIVPVTDAARGDDRRVAAAMIQGC